MLEKTTAATGLSLAGDWTISGVGEQFQLLAQHFPLLTTPQSLVEASTAQELPEIDLAGITALDACGCQLLARFALALHERGIAPRIHNIPETFTAKIRLLGFAHAFNLTP